MINCWDRVKEITPLVPLSEINNPHGLYWNNEQFRVELWRYGNICYWVFAEDLWLLNKKSDDSLKKFIFNQSENLATLLATFFYPGWMSNVLLEKWRNNSNERSG